MTAPRPNPFSILGCAPLEAGRMAAILDVAAFVRAGCCRQYGTFECLVCPLAELIPRRGCNPPADCPTCPQRTICPCGNDDLRQTLLADM